jgi:hypothetical protein
MKNIIVIITLLALGIVSCSSCAKQDQTPVEVPAPAPTVVAPAPLTINNDNLEVTFPSNDWKQLDVALNAKAFANPNLKNLVILSKESVSYTYDQYILVNLQGVKQAGGVVASVKQQDINGHKFMLVDSSKNGSQVLMWITLENGFGYSVACGGPSEGTKQKELCLAIAGTIKIN